jgi:hypothetical protein
VPGSASGWGSTKRVDWAALDQKISRSAKKAGKKLLVLRDFPRTITKRQVALETEGFGVNLLSRLDKLPKTAAVILKLTDDAKSLAMRRRIWRAEFISPKRTNYDFEKPSVGNKTMVN